MHTVQLIDKELLTGHDQDERYAGAPFGEIHKMQASAKGARFEKIVRHCLERLGTEVTPRESSEHDIVIGGTKIEIKGSTLIRDKNVFSFLQIRPEQDYDAIMLALFYPDHVSVLALSKQRLLDANVLKDQHGGREGHSGTYLFYATENELLDMGATRLFRCA
jgi:hypothetical protein